MKWITREKPKIYRLAYPWLIKRFIDQEAVFIYTAYELVLPTAAGTGVIPLL